MPDDIEIGVEVHRHTSNAIQVEDMHGIFVWIPRSQISDYSGESVEEAESIFIPEWLAIDKGLI